MAKNKTALLTEDFVPRIGPSYVPGFTPSLAASQPVPQTNPALAPTPQLADAGMLGGAPGNVLRSPALAQAAAALQDRAAPAFGRPAKGLSAADVQLQTVGNAQGLQFVTNRGNPASIKQKEIGKKGATATSTGFVTLDPNAQYRFINEKGKDRVLYTGTGEEGLKNVYAMAQDLSATKGKKANWGVEMYDPATGQWSRVADDDPAKSVLSKVGKVVGTALPIATALVPGLQFLGPIATTALAGGAGAALAGRDPLKGAVMGGLGAAGGTLLGPALQGSLGVGANAASAIGTGLGTTAGGLVTGQNLQNSLLGGVTAGALSYLGGELLAPKGASPTGASGETGALSSGPSVSSGAPVGPGDIVVNASPFSSAGALAGGAAGAALSNALTNQSPEQPADTNEIVVSGTRPSPLPSIVPGLTTISPPATAPADDTEIKVTAPSDPYDTLPVYVPPASTTTGTETDTSNLEKDFDKELGGSTLDSIIKYLRVAGLGTGLLGDLLGAGGGSKVPAGRIPAGIGGGLSSVFTKTLPRPTMPGLGAGSVPRTAADLGNQGLRTTQDWYRYGYGPEQSFFSGVPQGARNTSTAYTGYAEGGEVSSDYDYEAARGAGVEPDRFGHWPDTYKLPSHMTFSRDSLYSTPEREGGQWVQGSDGRWLFWPSEYNMRQHPMGEMEAYFRENEQGIPGRDDSYAVYPIDYDLPAYSHGGFAVGGPGDGRDDKIPAMLSDGEYVMDAETVAMLGNGSPKAGADALDQLCVSVRKHKGRDLAKGKFSAGAKKPEQYLRKGRK